MSNAMTVSGQIPKSLQNVAGLDDLSNDLSGGMTGGYAVVSVRGSKWRIKHHSDEKLVTNDNDDPVPSLEVVLVKASPSLSKIYYAASYVEGDDNPPDCWSLDGITPDTAVPKKQSPTCAACPHNIWGSKITPAGKKARACSDSRRVAVVPAGDIPNEGYGGLMLLRVPAASLGGLADYGRGVGGKGFLYNGIVTKIGFDPEPAFPKLTFKPVRVLTEEEGEQVAAHLKSPQLGTILHEGADLRAEATTGAEPEVEEADDFAMLDELAPKPTKAKEEQTVAASAEPAERSKPSKSKSKAAPKAEAAPPADEGQAAEADDDLNSLLSLLDD